MDKDTKTALELPLSGGLLHLQERTDVQNIDMMDLAGFCRNCLSRWYREAAADAGQNLSDGAAREIIYGMDYADWKAKFQTEATAAKKCGMKKPTTSTNTASTNTISTGGTQRL